MDAALIREVRCTARHHYGRRDWTEEENHRRFGGQVHPHEHEWRVRVELRGPIADETGFVIDLGFFDHVLERLVGSWEGRDLNEHIPEVRAGSMQPSTEALARWLHDRLGSEIPPPAKVGSVEVWESDELGARYPA